MKKVQLGKLIKEARETRGFSQRELGVRLGGVSQTQVSKWETAKLSVPTKHHMRLSKCLKIGINNFLSK